MAQLINLTSEALQATIRRLLPSQQGFGEDLQATNVVTPIIDLTPTAEGSGLPSYLQTSLAFGSQTAFSVSNQTTTVASTAGFYRIVGSAVSKASGGNGEASINLVNSGTTKKIWAYDLGGFASDDSVGLNFDFYLFLASGDSAAVFSDTTDTKVLGSIRQIADVNGTLTVPSGFTPQ
jgi:hypothetical protein